MKRQTILMLGALTAFVPAGCSGNSNAPACGEPGSNQYVMEGLRSTCEKCHSTGSNKPYFSSLQAFEDLLVYNKALVNPGNPAGSELMHLLEGAGTGPFKQMPTAGASFKDLDAQGQTQISLADITSWINALPPRSTPSFDYLKAPTNRRITAEKVLTTLDATLGLSDADFFSADYKSVMNADGLPARSADALTVMEDYSFSEAQVYPRFEALGGPVWLVNKGRDSTMSPSFLQAITQMAQARCRMAIEKSGNTAILKFVTLTQTSADADAAIRQNLSYLYLRFLGEVPTDAEIDDLHSLYMAYEPKDTTTAWTAVCAGLVRHPLFLTY